MNFETFEDAIHWRKVHRTKLKTATRRQRRAARPLMKCRRGHRCDTEACRVCLREFRLWWLGEAVRIVVQRPHWTRCSVIPEGWLVPYKQLSGFDLDAEIKRIRKRLERSALHGRVVLGGVDVSLNVLNNRIVGWQFHVYLIAEGANDKVLRNAIKAVFSPEPTAQEPYHFEQIDKQASSTSAPTRTRPSSSAVPSLRRVTASRASSTNGSKALTFVDCCPSWPGTRSAHA